MVPGSSFENRIELAIDDVATIFAQIATAQGNMPQFDKDNFKILSETTLQSLKTMSDIWSTKVVPPRQQAVPQQRVGMQQVQPANAPAAPQPPVIVPAAVPHAVPQHRVGIPPTVVQPSPIRVIPLLPPGLDLSLPQQQVHPPTPVRTSGRIITRTPLFSYTAAVVPSFLNAAISPLPQRTGEREIARREVRDNKSDVQLSAINIHDGSTASVITPNYAAMTKAIAAVGNVDYSNNYIAHFFLPCLIHLM